MRLVILPSSSSTGCRRSPVYVDCRGSPAELPEDTSRAVTIVEQEGQRIGALVHDVNVDLGDEAAATVLRMAGATLEGLRREAELLVELEDLRQKETQSRALLEAIPDIVFRFDRHGRYLYYQSERRSDLRLPPDGTLIGHSVHEVLPEDTVRRFLSLVERVLSDGGMQVMEYELDVEGERLVFEARIVACGPEEVLAIVRNVTERKKYEERLLQLQAQLRERLKELHASRARIVEAADAERRRVERDIHDGAQQRLLGVRLSLKLLRSRLEGAADQSVSSFIEEIDSELCEAVEELRTLAHGIHPAVLTDEGLSAALDVVARRSSVPVRISRSLPRRLPQAVEALISWSPKLWPTSKSTPARHMST
jgi:PAS domain S-box-containing protein